MTLPIPGRVVQREDPRAGGSQLAWGQMTEPNDKTSDEGFGLEIDDLVGRLDAFQLLRKTDEHEAKAVLEDLGAHSKVDRDIVLELGARRPLGHPDRFPEAHALAVRSLEVLDRNGHRSIPMPPLGPLRPIGAFLAQIVTQFIVRSYLSSTIDEMRRLYIRREAATLPNDPDLPMLMRARMQAERLTPGFKRNPLALPTFLFGGAVLSSALGAITSVVQEAVSNRLVLGIVAIVAAAIMAIASWVIVHGTAVARHRIDITSRKPVAAVWETVGRAGRPPNDQSMTFAVIAFILTIASVLFILIPVVLAGFR